MGGEKFYESPHFLLPPIYRYSSEPRGGRGAGCIDCGWGEIFAETWKVLFHNEKWLDDVLKPLFEVYRNNLPYPVYRFYVYLREIGPLFQVFPGDACDVGVYPVGYSPRTQRFGSHNVDNPMQLMALLQLSSIWFSTVADIANFSDSVENVSNLRFKNEPSHGRETIYWVFEESKERYTGGLYRVRTTGLPNEEHFVFSAFDFKARERVEELEGAGLFSSDLKIEEVAKVHGEDYEKLPLLVPIIGTGIPDDEEEE